MLSWPLCSNNEFSGSATACPTGDPVAAVSTGGSFRLAIADIQLLYQSIMLTVQHFFAFFV
jgi:hypothetical protein